MQLPRPVPSSCVDMTPPVLWDCLWKLDPQGELCMPTEYKHDGKITRFWKGYYNDTKNSEPPSAFWRQFHSLYPQGLPEDPTPRVYNNEWDDSKHGYWRVNGRLQFRHPDGTIFTDVTGADCLR